MPTGTAEPGVCEGCEASKDYPRYTRTRARTVHMQSPFTSFTPHIHRHLNTLQQGNLSHARDAWQAGGWSIPWAIRGGIVGFLHSHNTEFPFEKVSAARLPINRMQKTHREESYR